MDPDLAPYRAFMSPATSLVSVDFPQPEGPTTAANPPSGTLTSSPSSTGKGPDWVL